MRILLLTTLLICSVSAGQIPAPLPNPISKASPSGNECKEADTYKLGCVVQVVQIALMNAQTELEEQKLPMLKTVDLDFKTIVQKTVGGGLNFWIFSLGATHEKDVTNDVSFQWSKPPKLPSTGMGMEFFGERAKVVDLGKQLTETVVAASRAIRGQSKIGDLAPTGLTVTVAYAVQDTVSGGVSLPTLVAVTPSLNGKYQNSNTQTIKLTFENPSPYLRR